LTKSLYAIFASQLLVAAGFGLVLPFMFLFVEKLGNFTMQEEAVDAIGVFEAPVGRTG
jgi:hypothetical protein